MEAALRAPKPKRAAGYAFAALVAAGGTLPGLAAGATASTAAPATPATSPVPYGASCPTALEAIGGRSALATWSLRRLAEQSVVVPVDETDVAAATPEVQAGAGGVILFGSSAPADLGAALATLGASAPGGIGPFVMTDEEGGSVQRMANLVGAIPSARQMGKTMSPAAIERLAGRLGRRMLATGVTMDLAPVLDVDGGPGPNATNADGTRSFSAEEPIAARDGLAFAIGLERAGIIPVVKHFPGLGGATANTDVAPASTPPWLVEQRIGLAPFARAVAAHVPAVMVSNAQVPGLTSLPSSISPAVVTGVLRDRLHFHGLVLTDSLSARSISDAGYPVPRAAVAALRAGADMVLYDMTSSTAALTTEVVAALVGAVRSGSLARSRLVDAAAHVLGAKHGPTCA